MNYRYTTEDETEDEHEERPEDPTLSGGLPENFEDDADRQSLRTDMEDEEGEEDEDGQDEPERGGEELVFDSSGADSSDQEDAQKARNRGDGGSASNSRRSQWTPSPSASTVRQRKEWIIVSEIPKVDRCPDAIRREINTMLAHDLTKAGYRIPEADLIWGSNNYGEWKVKDVRFHDAFSFLRLTLLIFVVFVFVDRPMHPRVGLY